MGDEHLELVAKCFREHVSSSRLQAGQVLGLCNSQQGPLATLGFEIVRDEVWSSRLQVSEISQLAGCRCRFLGSEIATWALTKLDDRKAANAKNVIDFFDSSLVPVRRAATHWLGQSGTTVQKDPELWAMLLESPYPDIRTALVNWLDRIVGPGELGQGNDASSVLVLCATVILQIHSGGRSKLKAIDRLAGWVCEDPVLLPKVLPILSIAIRSIRGPEMRQALCAVLEISSRFPDQKSAIESMIPELEVA